MKKMNHTFRGKLTLAVVLLLVVAMMASFAGCNKAADPKEAVKEAAKATVSELGKVGDQFGYDEIAKLSATGNCHQEMNFVLTDANIGADLSEFYGSAITMTADSNIKERKMTADMGIDIGSYHLGTASFYFDDSMLYMACNELLGNVLYGIDTETMATDMPEAGLDESMNYNVFDIIDDYITEDGKFTLSSDTKAALLSAYDTMSDGSTWEAGKDKVNITSGSASADCESYTITIPGDKQVDFIISALDSLAHDEYCSMLLQSIMAYELTNYESYDAMIESNLADLKTELTDGGSEPLAITFFVKDKLLRGADFTVAGSDDDSADFSIRFGLEANVADYFEFTMSINDGSEAKLSLVSKGNHVLDGSKFTDSITFSMSDAADGEFLTFTADTDYDTASGAYTCDAYVEGYGEGITANVSGNLKIDGKTMDMTFDDITLDIGGMTVSLSGGYIVNEGGDITIDTSNVKLIKDLTDADLSEIETTVTNNGYTILMELVNAVPSLMDFFM